MTRSNPSPLSGPVTGPAAGSVAGPRAGSLAGPSPGTPTLSQRVLILDDVVSSRIVLKARLTAAAHEVVQAVSLEEGRAALAAGGFGLMILAGSFAALPRAEAICRELEQREPQAPPVLVLGPADEQDSAARLRLLAAGAAGHLPANVGAAALLAQLRALLRHERATPVGEGWAAPAARAAAPGFAAPAASGFAPRPAVPAEAPGEGEGGWLALVSARPQEAVALRSQLGRLVDQRLALFRPEEILPALRGGPLPEAVLILTGARGDPSPGDSGLGAVAELHLLAELRARAATARIPVLMLGASGPEVSILALDLGAQEVLPRGFTAEELALRLRHSLARARARAQRQSALAEELRQASTDALTGVANRRAILRRLEALHAEAGDGRPYALLLLDIDRFKLVNDTWGHSAGDRVLAALAARLAGALSEGDLLGRIGGEEFLVALPRAGLAEARAAADSLRRAVEAAAFPLADGVEVRVTISIGLCLPRPGEPLEQALAQADRALYAAKARGRNTVWIDRPAA